MFIDELLNNEDMNVIFIEWSNGAAFPYHQAVGNVRLVGKTFVLRHLILDSFSLKAVRITNKSEVTC